MKAKVAAIKSIILYHRRDREVITRHSKHPNNLVQHRDLSRHFEIIVSGFLGELRDC